MERRHSEKRKEKQTKEEEVKQRQKIEEQEKISNYYPPSPIYDPYLEDEILSSLTPQEKLKLDPNYYTPNNIPELEDSPVLVDYLVPAPTPDKNKRWKEDMQNEHGREIQKNFKDEDYYLDSGYIYESYV